MSLNLFNKSKLSNDLPSNCATLVKSLKRLKSKEDCLKKVYNILTIKYHGGRIATYLQICELLEEDLHKIWLKKGFLHCTLLNYLLRLLLVKSGHFSDNDIIHKWTLIWYISPHQYSIVKLSDDKLINIDLWAKYYGIKYGDYAHGFNMLSEHSY